MSGALVEIGKNWLRVLRLIASVVRERFKDPILALKRSLETSKMQLLASRCGAVALGRPSHSQSNTRALGGPNSRLKV